MTKEKQNNEMHYGDPFEDKEQIFEEFEAYEEYLHMTEQYKERLKDPTYIKLINLVLYITIRDEMECKETQVCMDPHLESRRLNFYNVFKQQDSFFGSRKEGG